MNCMTALVIDEVQVMPDELLEEVRLLANIESASEKLLSIVLAGQPEVGVRLSQPSLRQLKQRIGLRCALAPLDLESTSAYIAARVRTAGGEAAQLFTPDAVCEIHARSRGIPRTISVICDNALVSGFALDRKTIDRDLVLEVCADFDFTSPAADDVAPVTAAGIPPAVRPEQAASSPPAAGTVHQPGEDLVTQLAQMGGVARLAESAEGTQT